MNIKKYKVKIKVDGLLLAGLPEDQEALKFVAKESQSAEEEFKIKMEKAKEAGEKEVSLEEVRNKNIFRRENGIPCIDEHHIKGLFREIGRKTKENQKGIMRGKWKDIHTDPYMIFVQGEEVEEVRAFKTGFPNYASVVCIHEAVKGAEIEFILEDHGTEMAIEKYIEYLSYGGRYIGLGAARGKSGLNGSYGLFTLLSFEVG